jgi:hypothetical protein
MIAAAVFGLTTMIGFVLPRIFLSTQFQQQEKNQIMAAYVFTDSLTLFIGIAWLNGYPYISFKYHLEYI